MSHSTTAARRLTTFVSAARAAIEKLVPESRGAAATWQVGRGIVWVQWPRADGSSFGLGLRRHLDWVTGEVALSRAGCNPETLPLWTGGVTRPTSPDGYRIRLGLLLHDEDRWWSAGSSVRELNQRLEWLVLQLRVKAEPRFARHPLPT
jgi:hypothetical protein